MNKEGAVPKILKINKCDDCCHFDDLYYDYKEECTLLKRKIESKPSGVCSYKHPIPKDCPLEEAK